MKSAGVAVPCQSPVRFTGVGSVKVYGPAGPADHVDVDGAEIGMRRGELDRQRVGEVGAARSLQFLDIHHRDRGLAAWDDATVPFGMVIDVDVHGVVDGHHGTGAAVAFGRRALLAHPHAQAKTQVGRQRMCAGLPAVTPVSSSLGNDGSIADKRLIMLPLRETFDPCGAWIQPSAVNGASIWPGFGFTAISVSTRWGTGRDR